MCQFFSAVATRDGRLLFCETDSHEEIIRRARLRDTDRFIRHFVRLELVNKRGGATSTLCVDETSVPAWFDVEDWQSRMTDLKAAVELAQAAYNAAVRSAQAAYNAAVGPARMAYNAAVRSAQAAYNAAMGPAQAVYDVAVGSAQAAYNAAVGSARMAYTVTLSRHEGYLSA